MINQKGKMNMEPYDQEQWNQGQWYQEEQYQQSQYQQTQYQGQSEVPRNPTFERDLIFSIIHLVFCPIIRTIPLILTILANSSWKKGSYESYEKLTKAAKVILIIGWVLIGIEAIAVIGGFIYIFVGLATSGF